MKQSYFEANKPMVDYLTLTTYSGEAMKAMTDTSRVMFGGLGDEASRRYYHGQEWGDTDEGKLFIGEAHQKKGTHMMMVASGVMANKVMVTMGEVEARCTRIDLQVTIPSSPSKCLRSMADEMRSNWVHGRKRKVTLVDGDKGEGSTLYVGSRQSERFIRFYEKQGTDGLWYMRFEVEFKGGLAMDAYRKVARGGSGMIAPVLLAELQMIPEVGEVPDFLALWKELQTGTWKYVRECLSSRKQTENGDG